MRDEIEKELLLPTVNIYTKSQMSEQIKTILPAILALTISGLWLLYQLGVLKYLKKINDEKRILLPSLFFLTSPFIFSFAFSVTNIGNFTEIKGVNSVITILTTTASIYIANWFLDSYRKKQKQEEIARILVASLEEQLLYIEEIRRNLTGFSIGDQRFEIIKKNLAFIKNNDIYNLAFNQIGIFSTGRVKEITRYSTGLKQVIYELKKMSANKVIHSNVGEVIKLINASKLNAGLCLIILSKEIIGDEELFNDYKLLVKYHYFPIKRYSEQLIDGKRKYIRPELEDALVNIEKMFEQFGIANELKDWRSIIEE